MSGVNLKGASEQLAFESISRPALHFIDGGFVESAEGGWFDTLNPTTNEVLTQVAEGTASDVDRAVEAAYRAFHEGPWGRMSAKERAKYLVRIADAIERHGEELARLEVADTGLPISQARGQAARAAENFRFFAEMATRMTGETFPVGDQFLNYAIRLPVGVAGLITPWNTPLMLATWKIAPCLAAGNTAVLKPAEWSPLTATKLAEIVQEVDLPPGVFNVVHGFGEVAGDALVKHPKVPLISFTGETNTGRIIMKNGADGLKRFSMELGGKSPVVVFADADLDRALDAVIFGVYSLNGERCTAGSRLLIQHSIREEFEERLTERVRRIRLGHPLDPTTEVGPLIHSEHKKRVEHYLEFGRREGATMAVGGEVPKELARGNFVRPTLFVNVRNDMRIAQEEIFGPVLVSIPFATEEEAIQLANGVQYGLAAYIWTRDLERAHRVARRIESGMAWINSQNVRDLRTPFGGMKQSGVGREGGHYSFEFYTEWKTVHVALEQHPIPRFGVSDVDAKS
ncbi:5-carboxymethyl-2-hydroxymuconate semialdehyde dehydrogenase [Alicyclobacillus mali]|uniref:5-carboxymethyl-2-hydroxymuconate semialdehyde dehydrogenase n=1 Tax=Alicyclobacillus mali (ex Roth et al. 2021) TaxID=1123961 RepID=A0ABS0F1A5_9BACL|nr:5-carboxymethyl-2-hydroxymuconate semialdehyde dehydrogenase [Alicyclobacillus mali (ex Roth et al. 2021)]MBF8377066.1 5-carboxymethyl-2-hydroxymuconate semialdehyde dehydrogenase [Alicyclobacillus mali (ex Roth et al. 2021)]